MLETATPTIPGAQAGAPAKAAPPIAVPPKKLSAEEKKMWSVRDDLAYAGARTHTLVAVDSDGRRSPLNVTFPDHETKVSVPMSHATTVIGVDGFTVFNENGLEMRQQVKADGERGVFLAYDQTVASYEELTHDALVARVNGLPGGNAKKSTPKPDLISFLIEASLNPQAQLTTQEGGDLDLEEDDDFK